MEITLLYFAQAARLTGVESERAVLPDGSTASAALAWALRRHPSLAQIQETLLLAVDEQLSRSDPPLRGGERVALMPPFSGG